MRICNTCGVFYLEGQRHVCGSKSRALLVLRLGIIGVVGGGLTGYFLLTIIFCLVHGGNQCGVVGVFIGFPIGAVIGGVVAGVVAARIATHRGHDNR
jgi:hypothetical protein